MSDKGKVEIVDGVYFFMVRKYVNKLTIYLIKDNYQDYDSVVQNYDGSKNVGDYRFYYSISDAEAPLWIKKFFGKFL